MRDRAVILKPRDYRELTFGLAAEHVREIAFGANSGSTVMRRFSLVLLLLAGMAAPSLAADNSQQERMKDCTAQAAGMTGSARQTFTSSCLKGEHPRCTPGKSKPCGNSCISLDKV